MYFSIFDKVNDHRLTNIPQELSSFFTEENVIDIKGAEYRVLINESDDFQTVLCSSDKNDISSKKVMHKKFAFFQKLSPLLLEVADKDNQELRHSISQYNTSMTTDLFAFVPQEQLMERKQQAIAKYIEGLISKNTNEAAVLTQRILKNSIMTKNELAVIKMLSPGQKFLPTTGLHNIKKVVLFVYHLFENDFKEKEVSVEISSRDVFAKVNYELLQTVLVKLIDNAYKYSLPKTKLSIDFVGNSGNLSIEFSMISIHVREKSVHRVFEYGYRGKIAEDLYPGDGIGLHTAKRITNKLKGKIEFIPGEDKQKVKGVDYSTNQFKIFFPNVIKD